LTPCSLWPVRRGPSGYRGASWQGRGANTLRQRLAGSYARTTADPGHHTYDEGAPSGSPDRPWTGGSSPQPVATSCFRTARTFGSGRVCSRRRSVSGRSTGSPSRASRAVDARPPRRTAVPAGRPSGSPTLPAARASTSTRSSPRPRDANCSTPPPTRTPWSSAPTSRRPATGAQVTVRVV
jgi:hypothetical protein